MNIDRLEFKSLYTDETTKYYTGKAECSLHDKEKGIIGKVTIEIPKFYFKDTTNDIVAMEVQMETEDEYCMD